MVVSNSLVDGIVHEKLKVIVIAGANIQIATPVGYEPDEDVIEETKRLAKVCAD